MIDYSRNAWSDQTRSRLEERRNQMKEIYLVEQDKIETLLVGDDGKIFRDGEETCWKVVGDLIAIFTGDHWERGDRDETFSLESKEREFFSFERAKAEEHLVFLKKEREKKEAITSLFRTHGL